MAVKYFWAESNGGDRPSSQYVGIEPGIKYYVGMPMKKVDDDTVAPTEGDPEFICMAQYSDEGDVPVLEIPVMEIFPDTIYEKWNEDGTVEKVRFGGTGGTGGGGIPSDLVETVPNEVPLNITWDGDVTGKEVVSSLGTNVVKFSDSVLTLNEIIGSVITVSMNDGSFEVYTVTENIVQDMSAMGVPVIVIMDQDGERPVVQIVASEFSMDDPMGGTISMTAGIWFVDAIGDYYTSSLANPNVMIPGGEKTQIKPEFIPTHSHEWADIKDAPFYDKSTSAPLNITFDGDLTGKETADMMGSLMVKVSDAILTTDQILGSKVGYVAGDLGLVEFTVKGENAIDGANIGMPGFYGIAHDDYSLILSVYGDLSALGVSISTGTWFYYDEVARVQYLSNPNATITTSEIKKIDNKFIDAEWMATSALGKSDVFIPETNMFSRESWTSEIIPNSEELQIVAGETYFVVLDGKEYKCVAEGYSVQGFMAVTLGNAYNATRGMIGYPGKAEPFCVLYEGTSLQFHVDIDDGEYSFSIYNAGQVPAPIPEKFMPELTQVILISPSGKKFKTTVGDDGQLVTAEV